MATIELRVIDAVDRKRLIHQYAFQASSAKEEDQVSDCAVGVQRSHSRRAIKRAFTVRLDK